MHNVRFVLAVALLLGFPAQAAVAWPQFRGPSGDGHSDARDLPLTWSETSNVVWKVAPLGRGRSSPVVVDGRVWLTTAVERGIERTRMGSDDMQTAGHVSLHALCLDAANGRTLWQVQLYDVDQPDPVHWLNSWATPTPVVAGGRLYCDFGTFGTACLDGATGEVVWQKRLPLDHQVGPGSSPIIWENLLILVRDGRDQQYVTALDRQTGNEVWRTDRPPIEARSPNVKKSFSTPLLVGAGADVQLLSAAPHWVVSYRPTTGEEIWRARHGTGFSIGTCPSYADGLVVIGTGCMRPDLVTLATDGHGDVTESAIHWRTSRQAPVMSSTVIVGEELHWVSDRGTACCADLRTGEFHWTERLGEDHLASPLFAEGRIYYFGQEGTTTVIKPGKVFEKLATNPLEGTVIATPALIDGAIFLRTDTHLYRIGETAGP